MKTKQNKKDRARLVVFRSNKYIYAQIVDQKSGKTLGGTVGKSPAEVGKKAAEISKKHKVVSVVFDRGAYKFHGNVKTLAEEARRAGLEF